MTLSLDGNISYIGTEFIKLLNTGSSDLATVQYVDDAIAENGGGGGGNVDLSNYYTQTEADNLLNNKLNVNNPQDITGNLRLDPTNGLSKIILNAVSPPNSNDDFYCNGTGHFNGSLRVSVLTSDGDVNCDGVNADTFNSHITTNDIVFKHNDVEYMRFNATDDTIDLSKELNVGSSTLKINSLNTNGLNDMTFSVDTLGEFLRFQISDFTVRVPNNRSFLSQNIFTDIVKPLAFANDISLQGQNSTNDGYEEYCKINSTNETVDFNKTVNSNENIVMLPNKILYLDEGATNRRYIRSSARSNPSVQNHLDIVQENTSIGRIRLMIGSEENVIVENSQLYSKRVITAVAGVKSNTYNSNGDNDVLIQRNGSTAITLKPSNEVQFSGYLILNNISTPDNTDLALRRDDVEFIRLFKDGTTSAEAIVCSKQLRANGNILVKKLQINQFPVGIEYCDFRLEDADSVMRFYAGNSTSVNLQITNAGLTLGRLASCTAGLKTNSIDTYTDTDLIFRRNGTEFFRLKTTNIIEVADTVFIYTPRVYTDLIACKTLGTDTVFYGSNTASNQAVEYFRFNYLSESVDFVKPIKTNTVNSNGDNDLVFQRNGTEIVKFNSSNEAEFSQDIKLNTIGKFVKWTNCFIREGITTTRPDFDICMNDATGHMRFYVGSISNTSNIKFALVNNRVSCKVDLQAEDGITVFNGKELKTNTVNSNGNIDVSFQRNSVEFFKFQSSVGVDNNDIINVAEGKGISAQHVYGNLFKSRSLGYDTIFYGSNTGATARVEYMRYNYAGESLDFNTAIDNTGLAVIGNIVDTTVSDKKLKKNMNDIITDASKVVKNVNTKTFEYKDEKHGKGVQFGFVANDLLEELPDVFSKVIGQDKDGNYNINHIKLSVILWKALQEQILKNEEKDCKIEHLEARLFEVEDIIKELKGKKTTKPKAKAKSKEKAEK